MSARLIGCLLIGTLMMAVPAAFADPVIVNANFGAVPITCFGDYAYQGTGCTYINPLRISIQLLASAGH